MIDRERFTQARHSCLEPVRSVGKVPVGELSLSGLPECLSLRDPILTDGAKTGKRIDQRYHPYPSPKQGRPAYPGTRVGHSPWINPGASAGRRR